MIRKSLFILITLVTTLAAADILPPPDFPKVTFKSKPEYQVVDGKLGFWFPDKLLHSQGEPAAGEPAAAIQERWGAFCYPLKMEQVQIRLDVFKDYTGYWQGPSQGPNGDKNFEYEVVESSNIPKVYHVTFLTYEHGDRLVVDAVVTLRNSPILYHIWGVVFGGLYDKDGMSWTYSPEQVASRDWIKAVIKTAVTNFGNPY